MIQRLLTMPTAVITESSENTNRQRIWTMTLAKPIYLLDSPPPSPRDCHGSQSALGDQEKPAQQQYKVAADTSCENTVKSGSVRPIPTTARKVNNAHYQRHRSPINRPWIVLFSGKFSGKY